MFQMTVLAMGKLKENFYLSACAEYEKRLAGYCKFQLIELPEHRLPENPQPTEIAAGLSKEAERIRQKIPKGSWFCVLTPEGKELSSTAFAERLAQVKLSGKSNVCFLLGSSFGIDPSIKAQADFCMSMGKMTCPHHLARVMLLEQLYRAETIQAGTRYHK